MFLCVRDMQKLFSWTDNKIFFKLSFFKVDGPYKAIILPAAKEEGKKLKKR